MKIIFVVASRFTEADFESKSALAKSLAAYESVKIEIALYAENEAGLPVVYNHAIANASQEDDIFVFCHDDIYILDFYWIDQLILGLEKFDVVGLAGSKNRIKNQPSWLFQDITFKKIDGSSLSGIVAHGKSLPPKDLSIYGAPLQEVELLDGVFLACRRSALIDNSLGFDERFKFHFYDLDFCRSARMMGLKLGTIMLSVMHESPGDYGTLAWINAYEEYLLKWGD